MLAEMLTRRLVPEDDRQGFGGVALVSQVHTYPVHSAVACRPNWSLDEWDAAWGAMEALNLDWCNALATKTSVNLSRVASSREAMPQYAVRAARRHRRLPIVLRCVKRRVCTAGSNLTA